MSTYNVTYDERIKSGRSGITKIVRATETFDDISDAAECVDFAMNQPRNNCSYTLTATDSDDGIDFVITCIVKKTE